MVYMISQNAPVVLLSTEGISCALLLWVTVYVLGPFERSVARQIDSFSPISGKSR